MLKTDGVSISVRFAAIPDEGLQLAGFKWDSPAKNRIPRKLLETMPTVAQIRKSESRFLYVPLPVFLMSTPAKLMRVVRWVWPSSKRRFRRSTHSKWCTRGWRSVGS